MVEIVWRDFNHHSSTLLHTKLLHTTTTVTHGPHYVNHHSQSTLPQPSLTSILRRPPSTLPQPSLTSHSPYYPNHHSHYLIHYSQRNLHTTSTITHSGTSTLPQPSLTGGLDYSLIFQLIKLADSCECSADRYYVRIARPTFTTR